MSNLISTNTPQYSSPVPGGQYVGVIRTLESKPRSGANGKIYPSVKFEILTNHPVTGAVIILEKYHNLTTPKALQHLQRELHKIGIVVLNEDDLLIQKSVIEGMTVELTTVIQTSGAPSYFFQKKLMNSSGTLVTFALPPNQPSTAGNTLSQSGIPTPAVQGTFAINTQRPVEDGTIDMTDAVSDAWWDSTQPEQR